MVVQSRWPRKRKRGFWEAGEVVIVEVMEVVVNLVDEDEVNGG